MTTLDDLLSRKAILQATYTEKSSVAEAKIEAELICLTGEIMAIEDALEYYELDRKLGFYDFDKEYHPPLKEDEMIDLDEPIPF